jgi:long-chain fatty acid transport protein
LKSKLGALVILLTFLSIKAFGGGFQINEHSAKAMAMGGAFTAVANDASAIYFNGAGLMQLDGTNFLIGTTAIAPVSTFRGVFPNVTQYGTEKQVFFPTHAWISHRFSDKIAAGIGFTTPYGLETNWDSDWVGRYLAIGTKLFTFVITPVVAYKVSDQLSVSAGLTYSWANVTITTKSPQTPFPGDAFTSLDGKDNSAWGYSFGLMYKPDPKFTIGASLRSQIKYTFDGTATTTGASQLASQLPNGSATAKLTTPLNVTVGLAYDVLPQLKLSADFEYVGWSSYDTLAVDFSNPNYKDIASPRLYDNSYIVRLGGEYKLSDMFEVDAGIYYDKDPVKTEYVNPSLPDANRLGFSCGVGYKATNNLQINAAYLFIRSSELTVMDSQEYYAPPGNSPFNGTYNSYANLVSISLSYSL